MRNFQTYNADGRMFRNEHMVANSQNGDDAGANPTGVPAAGESTSGKKAAPEPDPVDINLLGELRDARKSRVAQIKAEIDAGTYESEELLDAALKRMIRGTDITEVDESDGSVEEQS